MASMACTVYHVYTSTINLKITTSHRRDFQVICTHAHHPDKSLYNSSDILDFHHLLLDSHLIFLLLSVLLPVRQWHLSDLSSPPPDTLTIFRIQGEDEPLQYPCYCHNYRLEIINQCQNQNDEAHSSSH